MMVYIIGSKIEEVNWLVASGYNDSGRAARSDELQLDPTAINI